MNLAPVDGVNAPANRRRSFVLAAGLLGGAGVSALVYRMISERLVEDGTFVAGADYPGAARDELLRYGPWVLIGVALVAGLAARLRPGRADLVAALGAFLFAGGFVWFLLSSLDMHVLRIYDWPEGGSHLLEDVVYHGGGMVVAAIGWLMVFPNGRPAANRD